MTSELANAHQDLDALKDLVRRHMVCWESYPIWHIKFRGEKVRIGYELDLIGTHDHPSKPPAPGCSDCGNVYRELMAIARAILPPDDRASRYSIEPYEVAIRFSPRRKFRKDVVLAIDIKHRDHFEGPIDECEERCLKEMTDKLKALGAKPDHW